MAHTRRQGKSSHVVGAWLGQTYLLVLVSLLERREAVTHPGNIQFQKSSGGHINSLASAPHLVPPSCGAQACGGMPHVTQRKGPNTAPPISKHAPGHVRAPLEGQAAAHSTRGQEPEARNLGPARQVRPYPGACWARALALPTSRSSPTSRAPAPYSAISATISPSPPNSPDCDPRSNSRRALGSQTYSQTLGNSSAASGLALTLGPGFTCQWVGRSSESLRP